MNIDKKKYIFLIFGELVIKKIICSMLFYFIIYSAISSSDYNDWNYFFELYKNAKDYNSRIYYLELGLKSYSNNDNAVKILKNHLVKTHYDHALLHSKRFLKENDGYDEAIYAFSKLLEINPTAHIYQQRGRLYLKGNEEKKGINDYKLAIKENPSLSNYFKLANVYNRQEKSEKAIKVYKKVIKLHPDDHEISKIYIGLGRTLISLKKFKEAYNIFTEFIKKKNQDKRIPECLFWQGYILAKGLNQVPEGYQLIKKAINKGYNTKKSRHYLYKYQKHPDIRIVKKNPNEPSCIIKNNPYSFLAIADTHVYHKKNSNLKLLKRIINEKDKFILILGDITQNGKSADYRAFKQYMKKIGLPYFSTIGNHDIYNSRLHNGWKNYKKELGDSYYTFSTGKIRFICLDTASLNIGKNQLAWFEEILKKKKEKFCVVFTHFPIFPNPEDYPVFENEKEAEKVLKLLKKYNVNYFINGHTHKYYSYTIKGIPFITLSEFKGKEKNYLRFYINKNSLTFEKLFIEL